MEKFKVFTAGDADTTEAGSVNSNYSHVLEFNEKESKFLEARFNGNNGKIFSSEHEAEDAVKSYKQGNFNLRFLDFQISRVS